MNKFLSSIGSGFLLSIKHIRQLILMPLFHVFYLGPWRTIFTRADGTSLAHTIVVAEDGAPKNHKPSSTRRHHNAFET